MMQCTESWEIFIQFLFYFIYKHSSWSFELQNLHSISIAKSVPQCDVYFLTMSKCLTPIWRTHWRDRNLKDACGPAGTTTFSLATEFEKSNYQSTMRRRYVRSESKSAPGKFSGRREKILKTSDLSKIRVDNLAHACGRFCTFVSNK